MRPWPSWVTSWLAIELEQYNLLEFSYLRIGFTGTVDRAYNFRILWVCKAFLLGAALRLIWRNFKILNKSFLARSFSWQCKQGAYFKVLFTVGKCCFLAALWWPLPSKWAWLRGRNDFFLVSSSLASFIISFHISSSEPLHQKSLIILEIKIHSFF